jgi:charged multivesicular body protein 4
MFSRLFGQPAPTVQQKQNSISVNESILKLKNTDSTIDKKITHLEKQITKLEDEARKLVKLKTKSSKQRALAKLKLKNLKMKELNKLMGMQYNLSVQSNALQNAQFNTLVIQGMKDANNTFQKINKSINIDKVDDLVEDLNEQQDLMNEVSDALATPLFDHDFDEDELLAELDELEELDNDLNLLPNLPEVPKTETKPIVQPIIQTEEEKELKELEMLMN